MSTHTDHCHEMKVSYFEASQSCNLFTHLGWLITDASPEVGKHGLVHVNPKQHEQVINLFTHLAWLITDATPEVGEHGLVHVNPKQHEQVLNLPHNVCRAVACIPTPKYIEIALHIV